MQGSAKEWFLGFVIPASWLPLTAGARFTQPRQHSLANPCVLFLTIIFVIVDDSSATNTSSRPIPVIVNNSIKIICAGSSFNNHSSEAWQQLGHLMIGYFCISRILGQVLCSSERKVEAKIQARGSGGWKEKVGKYAAPTLAQRPTLARSLARSTDGRSV